MVFLFFAIAVWEFNVFDCVLFLYFRIPRVLGDVCDSTPFGPTGSQIVFSPLPDACTYLFLFLCKDKPQIRHVQYSRSRISWHDDLCLVDGLLVRCLPLGVLQTETHAVSDSFFSVRIKYSKAFLFRQLVVYP